MTERNALMRLNRSTSISGSGDSPAISAIGPSGRVHCALRTRLALVQELGRRLELLMLEQPANERVAGILFGIFLGRIGTRQQRA